MNGWRLPPELDVPVPRPVKMNTAYIVLTIFLFVPLIFLSIFMIGIFFILSLHISLAHFIGSEYLSFMLFPLLSFSFIYIFYRKYKYEKYILQYGEIAFASIAREYEYDSRTGMLSEVTYSFMDRSGNVVAGSRKGVPAPYSQRDELNEIRAQILSNPTALYDPKDSSKNILYPPRFVSLA